VEDVSVLVLLSWSLACIFEGCPSHLCMVHASSFQNPAFSVSPGLLGPQRLQMAGIGIISAMILTVFSLIDLMVVQVRMPVMRRGSSSERS